MTMQIIDWSSAPDDRRRAVLARPAAALRDDVFRQAAEIIAAVRAEGDAAVRRITRKFGGHEIAALTVRS